MIAPWTRLAGALAYYQEIKHLPKRFPSWCDLEASALVPFTTAKLVDTTVVRELNLETPRAFSDHMELSGRTLSALLTYGCDAKGSLRVHRHLVFPSLRISQGTTRGHLAANFDVLWYGDIRFNGKKETEQWFRVEQRGHLQLTSRTERAEIQRTYHVSPTSPSLIESIRITNTSRGRLKLDYFDRSITIQTQATKRHHTSHFLWVIPSHRSISTTLKPKETFEFSYVYRAGATSDLPRVDRPSEIAAREAFVDQHLTAGLQLVTPNPIINTLFSYAKLRGLESCFETVEGALHSPGGGEYYAAIWTNDQAEYSYPLFPMIGDEQTTEAALRGYRLFARMIHQGKTQLPSSLVDGGRVPFSVAGDRGDNAMYASGLLRFLLSSRNLTWIEELLPAAETTIMVLLQKRDSKGRIRSSTDELEGRFPSGRANLATQALAYDALLSLAYLKRSLNQEADALKYEQEAVQVKECILTHFRAEVEGFDTYRYYRRNHHLRSWIILPLTVGIEDAAETTLQALFSDKLWVNNRLKTASNKGITWDRSLLFGLRAAFQANQPDLAYQKLLEYSKARLLGSHTPYPVEAYPEGNGAHLAAESFLYLRIFTEGLFGLRPLSLESYELKPTLPRAWSTTQLQHVSLFGVPFTLRLEKENGALLFRVEQAGTRCYEHRGAMGERFVLTSSELNIEPLDIPEPVLPLIEEPVIEDDIPAIEAEDDVNEAERVNEVNDTEKVTDISATKKEDEVDTPSLSDETTVAALEPTLPAEWSSAESLTPPETLVTKD